MSLKTKNKEYEQFDNLSNEWWNENGKFRVLHEIRPIRIDYILKQIKNYNVNNLEILDIGCGGGLVSESLAKLGARVTGIDFVNKNIDNAKQHAKENKLKINYICNDIEKLKLKKKYDLIIVFEVLEHLDNWNYFLKNIKKNLKDNGKIIISTINRNLLSKYTAIFIAENILNWIPKNTHDYNKFIRPDEIKKFLEKNKMYLDDITGLVFNPLVNRWSLSNNTSINYFCTLSKIN